MSGDSSAFPTDHDEQDDIEFHANDETRSAYEQRQRTETNDAKLRRALDDPKRARAAYRDIADAHTALTHAQFRVLSYLLRKADPDLTNAFPSQVRAAKALGMKRSTYNWHLVALRHAGWVLTHEFHHEGGQSSSGVQFCIPVGVLPLGEPWIGPAQFDGRWYGTPKRPRKRGAKSVTATEPVVGTANNGETICRQRV